MALDITIALVDVSEVKTYGALSQDDPSDIDLLESLINSASQDIADYCNREFILVSEDVSEIFEGDGTDTVYLRNAPITSDISATSDIYYWSGTEWTNLTSATIRQNSAKGIIKFTDGNRFIDGLEYKITYQYGWSQSNVPADLKEACCRIVLFKRKLYAEDLHGISVRNFVDESTSYSFNQLPDDVKRVMNKYRRFTTGRLAD